MDYYASADRRRNPKIYSLKLWRKWEKKISAFNNRK